MQKVILAVQSIFRDSLFLYWELLKIMVPIMVLVKIAIDMGVVEFISPIFEPLMVWVGLPPVMGLVWVTTMFVNPYAGAVVLLELLPDNPLTSAQITVLGAMMLMAHSLPVEGRIVQKAGGGLIVLNLLRIGSALVLGMLLCGIYQWLDILQGTAQTRFFSTTDANPGWVAWFIDALDTLVKIFVIILFLLSLLRLFDYFGVTQILTKGMRPLLRFLGISSEATHLVVSGSLLGLAFGGVLIINEVKRGSLGAKDIYLSLIFLCLCHGLIEDTLFIMALGGNLSGIFVGRIIFTIIFIYIVARLIHAIPDRFFRCLCTLQKTDET